jgi:toxin-antitoxin system PIN domain toxin
VIALDTNILVYAHRVEMEWHGAAARAVAAALQDSEAVGVPWQCIAEFLSTVTNPRVFPIPTPLGIALDQLDAWRESPAIELLSERESFGGFFTGLVREARVTGPRVHDARIAAICLEHGVRELWTADRDFSRFPQLRTQNPLVGTR